MLTRTFNTLHFSLDHFCDDTSIQCYKIVGWSLNPFTCYHRSSALKSEGKQYIPNRTNKSKGKYPSFKSEFHSKTSTVLV